LIFRPAAKTIRLPLLIALLTLLATSPAEAAVTSSPEALAMMLVSAYRAGDLDTIVTLYKFTDAGQAAQARHDWRETMRRYRLTGCRVVNLSAEERRRLPQLFREGRLSLLPLKKLVIELSRRNGEQEISAVRYIGADSGSYFFVTATDGMRK
jgi:hypothetical protein